MQQKIPRIEVRDGEVWVCLGATPSFGSMGLLLKDDYDKLRKEIAANERQRIAYVLDHMEEFASWIQYKGKDVEGNPPLDINSSWVTGNSIINKDHENAKPSRPSK